MRKKEVKMASLKDVPMSALLEEIVSRASSLAFIGNFVINGEEHEMGMLHGPKEINYYNLALLQADLIHGPDEPEEEDSDEEAGVDGNK